MYNLYGIKAYDSNPYKRAAAYARKKGWTTVKKAIAGAADYLSGQYVHSRYRQNTPFKLRYHPGKQMWHQYATDPYYAEKLGQRIYELGAVYREDAVLTFDFPKYKS